MHVASCTNTHHEVTDFADLGMVKNTKTWIPWQLFYEIKKFLTSASDDTFREVIVL